MFDKLKIAFVLVAIGAISGITIYTVNILTKDTIAQNIIEKEQSFYKELFYLDEDTEVSFESIDLEDEAVAQEVIVYDAQGDFLGYIYKGIDQNNYGEVVVLIGVTLDGEISNVVISSTTNTPNFAKIIEKKYLSPFGSQNVDNISIDSSTGATYTYTSVVKIVENAATYFLENRGELHD